MPTTTRYYLPGSGTPPGSISPAFGALWDITSARVPMSPTPSGSALATVSHTETSASVVDICSRQFIGPNDLPAGSVEGSFDLVVYCSQATATADMYLQVVIAVISADGLTRRGELYAGQAFTTVSASPTDPNYEFHTENSTPLRTRILSSALTPVTAQAGDRLVVEIGCRATNLVSTSRAVLMRWGAPVVASDYTLTVDQAGTTERSWIEFHIDDPLDPPDDPVSLAYTPSPDGTELEFDWASGGGFPEDGYEVRIDGGSAIDVGDVLTHDFTGLDPGTAYTLEVRAYNAAGNSAWVSLGATTTGPPGTPTGLSETVLSGTEVELDWTASTGSPDGYEVRVDGGLETDIGNVLTHTFTGLAPGSSPLLEVRAYNEAGFSAWASVEPDIPPATEGYFLATITLGEHVWEIESGACDFEDPVQVLDSLRIGWEVDEATPWPAQPGPVTCQFQLWTADVAELADVNIGTPLEVILTDITDTVFATFHGRVASQSARPRKNVETAPGLSMTYSLSAVDYTVDLAETPVVIRNTRPPEDAASRITWLFTTLTDAGVPMDDAPIGFGDAAFEAYDAGTTTAAQLLEDHLRQLAVDNGEGLQRYVVVPQVTAGLLESFSVVLMDRVVDASLLPGVLDVVGGELVLLFPDMDAQGVVDACAVDLDTTWNRLKYRAVNVVTVTSETFTERAATGSGSPIRLNLETSLSVRDAARRMAKLYLPDTDETNGWVADTFRLYAYRSPAAITPAWFPDHRDPAGTTVYVMPIAVLEIPANINLAGEDAYAGQLVHVELTLAKKRAQVEFALRRQLPTSSGDDAVTWDWITANHPTLTWDDAPLSWYDMRLGRTP